MNGGCNIGEFGDKGYKKTNKKSKSLSRAEKRRIKREKKLKALEKEAWRRNAVYHLNRDNVGSSYVEISEEEAKAWAEQYGYTWDDTEPVSQ